MPGPSTAALQLPPLCCASSRPARTAPSAALENLLCWCSAKTSTFMSMLLEERAAAASDDLGLGVQQLDQLLHASDLLAGLTLRRRFELVHLHRRRRVHSDLGQRQLLQLL